MFIQDGKTLFGNTGLFISIVILILLLLVGYRKCYLANNNNSGSIFTNNLFESFGTENTAPPASGLRLILDKNNVIIKFTVNKNSNGIYPDSFLIVLAQYNSEKKPTGNNLFNITSEYMLNANQAVGPSNQNANVCELINGKPSCQYKFENLDIRDPAGNLYYYKLGVYSILNGVYSQVVTPDNLPPISNNMFTLESSLEEQTRVFKAFNEFRVANAPVPTTKYDNTMANANGDYELIKKQLGNYPDNALLDNELSKQDSLQDLVGTSMALGVVNVKIN